MRERNWVFGQQQQPKQHGAEEEVAFATHPEWTLFLWNTPECGRGGQRTIADATFSQTTTNGEQQALRRPNHI